jgi:hypothetical protein
MADSPAFIAGQHEAQIKALYEDMASVKADVQWIREHLAERRGERRVSLYLAGTGGGIVATLVTFFGRKAFHLG